LKILGLATLIGAIVIGALIIFVGPIVMGFFKNPTAAIIALGKAFAFGVALCAVLGDCEIRHERRDQGKVGAIHERRCQLA
jgi:hypothetical protein